MRVDPRTVNELTLQEIRVLFEGQRVDNEIEEQMTKIQQAGGPEEAMGSVVPRESDLEQLEEFERKLN